MSTNYYLQKDPYGPRHLGKTYFGGTARGLVFTWAIPLDDLQRIVAEHDVDQVEVRRDGEVITLREFLTFVYERVQTQEYDHVGTEFS